MNSKFFIINSFLLLLYVIFYNFLQSFFIFDVNLVLLLFIILLAKKETAFFWTVGLGFLLDNTHPYPSGTLLFSLLFIFLFCYYILTHFLSHHNVYNIFILIFFGTCFFHLFNFLSSAFFKMISFSEYSFTFNIWFFCQRLLANFLFALGIVVVIKLFFKSQKAFLA